MATEILERKEMFCLRTYKTMKIISFAWTTPALLQGHKTVTRRMWKKQLVNPGDLVQAYNRSPRFKGKPVALIKILDIRTEPLSAVTDQEEKLEGGLWGSGREYIKAFLEAYPGMTEDDLVWRIEFKVLKIGI
jgi:hypothetical protein